VKTITDRLAYAFLMNSAIQRNGERVTAEEIRYMAGELEDALGGVYSIMAHEFQLPFIKRTIYRLTKAKKLPPLPKGVAKPVIVTGLEALGRGHDLNKLQLFLGQLGPLAQLAMPYINLGEVLSRVANAVGLDPVGLIKTPEEMAQAQQQAQQQASAQTMTDMAGKAAPAVIKALSDQKMAKMQQQTDNQQAPQGNQ
jgi:hypothetical protein